LGSKRHSRRGRAAAAATWVLPCHGHVCSTTNVHMARTVQPEGVWARWGYAAQCVKQKVNMVVHHQHCLHCQLVQGEMLPITTGAPLACGTFRRLPNAAGVTSAANLRCRRSAQPARLCRRDGCAQAKVGRDGGGHQGSRTTSKPGLTHNCWGKAAAHAG
jgi:hypothetical protein